VLQRERAVNGFLRATADEQITHHIDSAVFATDSISLCYVGTTNGRSDGTWSMSMIYMHIPNNGADFAFNAASKPIPLSNKRAFYGHSSAQSAQDLRDENALVDVHDHATTMVML